MQLYGINSSLQIVLKGLCDQLIVLLLPSTALRRTRDLESLDLIWVEKVSFSFMVIVTNARWHIPSVTLPNLENPNNGVANGLKPNKHCVLVSQYFLKSSQVLLSSKCSFFKITNTWK